MQTVFLYMLKTLQKKVTQCSGICSFHDPVLSLSVKTASSFKYNSTRKNIIERWSTYFKCYISPKLSQIAQSTTSFFVYQRFEVKVEEGCATCRIICGLIAF